MKTKLALTVLFAASVLMIGCDKKDPPRSSDPSQARDEVPSVIGGLKEAAVEVVKESFTMEIDLEKAVADLEAEAAKMEIESLKEVADKYKEALAVKETELKALMDKLSAVPLTEKLGKEAKAITGEIKTVTDALAALQERFQVYIDALAEKGAVLK